MRFQHGLAGAIAFIMAAACSGGNASLPADSAISPVSQDKPAVMLAVDGIPGWTRDGDVETYTKEGLYGYIDGGAEIVLQYGFRELAVFKFKPATTPAASKELILEIYRMESGEAAFGLYSTKLEGEEQGWPGIGSENWVGPGQGGLVKGEYMVNILAPECADREIGEFAAALEPKVPGTGTVRPKGMDWLPREGRVASSGRYIKGPLAAQNESPFLEGDFWGFGAGGGAGNGGRKGTTEAYSAKYGVAPGVSKLIIVKFADPARTEIGGGEDTSTAEGPSVLTDKALASFGEYLKDVRRAGESVEGRNEAGRWFIFKAKGRYAVLVLGETDKKSAVARLDLALASALAAR